MVSSSASVSFHAGALIRTKALHNSRVRFWSSRRRCLVLLWVFTDVVTLGGIVVSVIAIGLNIRGFKHCHGRWIFNGDKNP
jgi:hypothetical protein